MSTSYQPGSIISSLSSSNSLAMLGGDIVSSSGDVTLDSTYSGKILVLAGASGTTLTAYLPIAMSGAGPFTVVNMGAHQTATVKLKAASDDIIWFGGASCVPSGFWQTVVKGAHTTAKSLDETNWMAFSWDTEWTKDGP